MNIIVFGATGMVGTEIVKQALYMGHQVKAFGRNVFTANLPQDENLTLVQGALFGEDEVLNVIKGCDAVLSALGGGIDGTDVTRSLGIKNIVQQMQKCNTNRIISVGGMGILNADENTLMMNTPDFPKEFIAVSNEHVKAYNFLKNSSLNYTIVCPPEIINAAPTGSFVVSANTLPSPNTNKINAGNLAMFMLNEISKNEFIKQRVGICNT